MAKIQISTRLEENLLKGLNEIILNDSVALTYKIETLLKMNINNYNKALKSLIGKFSHTEVCYIAQAFNGIIIQKDILTTTEYLYMIVNDFYKFGSVGFYSDKEIDIKKLLNRLKHLSDYQALVIINSIEDFWNDEDKNINDLLIVEK